MTCWTSSSASSALRLSGETGRRGDGKTGGRAMRAVRVLGAERVGLIDMGEPEPPEGGVIVRLRASGLCGSELHGYRGATAMDDPPNGGHEPAGEVVDASR